jgi:putative toxin-antitoxin system antitoxin component (TIGR02293 family)
VLTNSSAYNDDIDMGIAAMTESVTFNRDEAILALLGGPETVNLSVQDLHTPAALTRIIRFGLPIESAYYARDHLGVDRALFHTVLPRTTLESARRKQNTDRLTKTTSETLFRMVRIRALAEEAFGDAERAAQWLSTPKRIFDDEAPLSLLDTESGAGWVEQVLMRMMYGIDV